MSGSSPRTRALSSARPAREVSHAAARPLITARSPRTNDDGGRTDTDGPLRAAVRPADPCDGTGTTPSPSPRLLGKLDGHDRGPANGLSSSSAAPSSFTPSASSAAGVSPNCAA